MTPVNWSNFEALPGSKQNNFEMLCRNIIWRNYNRYGRFVSRPNQPGVEFHLKLHTSCELGDENCWLGWQCRWYDIPSGRSIDSTRRKQIKDAIEKTEKHEPGITDWVLWTRHTLTKGDQKWFYGLEQNTHMRLKLWTSADVENLLCGDAVLLRDAYFGELVLTPHMLAEQHKISTERIRHRWLPDVHQVVDVERRLQTLLCDAESWNPLLEVAKQLGSFAQSSADGLSNLPGSLVTAARKCIDCASTYAAFLHDIYILLDRGDFDVLRQRLSNRPDLPSADLLAFPRCLRNARHAAVFAFTNALADMHLGRDLLDDVENVLGSCLVGILANAGGGKTQLAAQLTAHTANRPAGILLHGQDLHAGQNLDDLAKKAVIPGKSIARMEALVAAVDAAGQRASRKLPIVIDGLNEAEDPRDWKGPLASLREVLKKYPYVLVVCTVRTGECADEALPEDVDRLEISDYGSDVIEAIKKYFKYYRINATDATLPYELLMHPLTLRIFCDVTNPNRKPAVGVEAMPLSLSALFDRYLKMAAERIANHSHSSQRYYEQDVRDALDKIGIALWEQRARCLEEDSLRQSLGDNSRSWDKSIIRALQNEGVISRSREALSGRKTLSAVYDPLAGHLVANAILSPYGSEELRKWLKDPDTIAVFAGPHPARHPIASDIFKGLVGLIPRRLMSDHLWHYLDEPLRSLAVIEAAGLEGAYLDTRTTDELAAIAVKPSSGSRDLFHKLWSTRCAPAHPLNAAYLDNVLRSMNMEARDLCWSEWIRCNKDSLINDLKGLELRWRKKNDRSDADHLRASWVMWMLPSTVQILRDHATRALYVYGVADPSALFDLTVKSLPINDLYVPERMLAASYGVGMYLWANGNTKEFAEVLQRFAVNLLREIFMECGCLRVHHTLIRDYALGVIELARMCNPTFIESKYTKYIHTPYLNVSDPFPKACDIQQTVLDDAEYAIHMDFQNYTIGGLIKNRAPYDMKNPDFNEVYKKILWRVNNLGYRKSLFEAIDRSIAKDKFYAEYVGKVPVDRYGKKYSWIAYFEMYGLLQSQGKLPDYKQDGRCPDCDIDPSFPEEPPPLAISLPVPFRGKFSQPEKWMLHGGKPKYDALLVLNEIDGIKGPWALLDGFVEQNSKGDPRKIFSFLRGLFIADRDTKTIKAWLDNTEYPGNDKIPRMYEDYYTYAGEIPWSKRYARGLRDEKGRVKRHVDDIFVCGAENKEGDEHGKYSVEVEIPVFGFGWESYHSALNKVGSAYVPAPSLSEKLGFRKTGKSFDMADEKGRIAVMFKKLRHPHANYHLLYMRKDMLKKYLRETEQKLIWIIWGERRFDYKYEERHREVVEKGWDNHQFIHKEIIASNI